MNGKRPEVRTNCTLSSGVYLPTQISTFNTTASCAGTVDESCTTLAYYSNGYVTATAAAGNGSVSATSAATYDLQGNVLTVDGPLAGTADTTRIRYNAARQVVGVVGPDPDAGGVLKHRAQRFTYNPDSQLTVSEAGTADSQSDAHWAAFASAQQLTSIYDANGRKVKEVLSAGGADFQVAQLGYDARGRPDCTALRMNPAVWASLPASACTLGTAGTAGPDRISKRLYDDAGQVTKVQTAVGTSAAADDQTMTYTPNGRLATLTDGELNKTSYEYDGHDRLLKTRFPLPTKGANASSTTDYEQLSYDPNGNVTQRRLRDGVLIDFNVDALNRVTQRGYSNGEPTAVYGFDLLGRLKSAAQGAYSMTMAYDALGRNTSIANHIGTISYQYDAAGRRTRLTWPDAFYVTYEYLVTGDFSIIRENGGSAIAWFAYDDLGRRVGLGRGNGAYTYYGYDAASRLSSLTQDPSGAAHDLTLGFGYTPASQLATTTRSNDAYAWTAHSNVNRPYTANGLNQYSLTGSITPTYDGRGNLTSAGGATYGYTAENQLKSASGIGTLAYDPLGRLVETAAASTTRFGYDGVDMIGEYNSSNTLQRRYVHGPGADEPLVWYEGSGTTDRRWLHADERGSVIAVTNASGAATILNSYDEYGIPGAANQGRFQYTGQAWLSEFGLYHYKARTYSPTLGRFLQTDPIGYGDGMNLYAYVGGDPVNGRDPSGMATEIKAPPTLQEDKMEDIGITAPFAREPVKVLSEDLLNPTPPFPFNLLYRPNGKSIFERDVAPREPNDGQQRTNNPCGGPVRAMGINFTGILGLGVTASVGKVTIRGSGASSWFVSSGVGAGVDAGISGFVSRYRDIGSFSGYGENYNGSIAIGGRTFGGSASYNVQGERVGSTGSGSGIPAGFGGRIGVSGTATDTTLLDGQCK